MWFMLVDDYSNLKGSRVGIMLEGLNELLLEQSLCFNFQTINNHEEYEALIMGTKLSYEVGATNLKSKSNS